MRQTPSQLFEGQNSNCNLLSFGESWCRTPDENSWCVLLPWVWLCCFFPPEQCWAVTEKCITGVWEQRCDKGALGSGSWVSPGEQS